MSTSIKQFEDKVVDSLQDFFWHYENHILPYIQKKQALPASCRYCKTALGGR